MKLNFLSILKGEKSSPEEIAEQIVILENKVEECRETQKEAKEASKKIRQRKLCGDDVPESEETEVNKRYEEAGLNLEAIQDSVEELKAKLKDALVKRKDDIEKRALDMNKALGSHRHDAMAELTKAKARLLACARAIWGNGARYWLDDGGYATNEPEYQGVYNKELEEAEASLKRPTYHERKQHYDTQTEWLRAFDLEDQFNSVIKKYRLMTTDPKETQEKAVV